MQSCATMETQDSRGGHGGMLTDSLILPQSRPPFILPPASVCPAMEGGNGLEVFLLRLLLYTVLYCVILCYTVLYTSILLSKWPHVQCHSVRLDSVRGL